ncbi:MAG: endo-1,4-beta-xylanase [Candidatus Azobacteroides sp.]|nr:endo-1,4-beta-xylanase [Candidatus Azobacteroides sp.]
MKNVLFLTLLTLQVYTGLYAQNSVDKTVFDFESGNLSGWNKLNINGEIEITREDKHDGQYSLKLVTGTSCTNYWDIQLETPQISVNSTHFYRISFWARTVGGNGMIRISTADPYQLKAETGGADRQYLSDMSIGSGWTQYAYETVYGSRMEAVGNILQLRIDAGKVAGKTYYLDDIVIEDLSYEEPLEPVAGGTIPLAEKHEKFLGNIVPNDIPAFFDLYWNQITPENSGKWASVEPWRGNMTWTALDKAYNYAKKNGYKFKYHTFVWGSQEPSWISSVSPAEQKAAMENFMRAVAVRYPDIDFIDVVNEPLHAPSGIREALGGDGATGWDWVIWSFQKAREYFPKGKLLINEYGIISDVNAAMRYLEIVNILKERNLIDGIGIQCHEFNINGVSVQTMKTVLDLLGATGLPIFVSELDVSGNPAGNEESQYQIYKEKFPVLWEHESVTGITLWGYITGTTWKEGTGIVASNGQERKAMVWLKNYMASEASQVPDKFESAASQKNIFHDEEIEIYPNPATSYLIVKGNGVKRMDIYDISGKRLMTQYNDGYINIERLEKGVYLLKVETESGTVGKKILKQ